MLAANIAFILAVLGACAVCGWWVVAPFRDRFAFPLAQAPLAGLLTLTLATLSASVVFQVRVAPALLIGIALTSGASAVTWIADQRHTPTGIGFVAGIAALIAGAAALLVTSTDVFFDAPGLLFYQGYDHVGYAQVADWLRLRPGIPAPTGDSHDWYTNGPRLLHTLTTRFGSMALLAIVSVLSGRSGAFAFDLASALALCAAALGVAGCFARRRLTFVVVALGLLTSFWFDWSRLGFFGKINGYPASIFAAALFCAWMRIPPSTQRAWVGFIGVVMVSCAASVMFEGVVTAVLVGSVGAACLIVRIARDARAEDRTDYGTHAMTLGLLVCVCILSSGIVARPLYLMRGGPVGPWERIVAQALEVQSLMPGMHGLGRRVTLSFVTLMALVWAGAVGYALRRRRAEPAAFLVTPLLLLGAFFVTDRGGWHAFQFVGTYFPMILGGIALLEDGPDRAPGRSRGRWTIVVALVVLQLLHLPRFVGVAAHYGGNRPPTLYRFSSVETEQLVRSIAREGEVLVDIDTDPLHFVTFLVVELGYRDVPVQWSARSWPFVLGSYGSALPVYRRPAPLVLVMRSPANSDSPALVMRTAQFDLLRRAEHLR